MIEPNLQKLKTLCVGNKGCAELISCGHDNVFCLHTWRQTQEQVETELTALGFAFATQEPTEPGVKVWIVGVTPFDLDYYLNTWQPARLRPKDWGKSDILDFA